MGTTPRAALLSTIRAAVAAVSGVPALDPKFGTAASTPGQQRQPLSDLT